MKLKGSELQRGMKVQLPEGEAEVRTTGRAGRGKRFRLGLRQFAAIDQDAEYEVTGYNADLAPELRRKYSDSLPLVIDPRLREKYLGNF